MTGKTFASRPSEIIGLADFPLLAYQFDDAVLTFGLQIENKMGEKRKNGKPKYKLSDLLKDDEKPGGKPSPKAIRPKTVQDAMMLMGGIPGEAHLIRRGGGNDG